MIILVVTIVAVKRTLVTVGVTDWPAMARATTVEYEMGQAEDSTQRWYSLGNFIILAGYVLLMRPVISTALSECHWSLVHCSTSCYQISGVI